MLLCTFLLLSKYPKRHLGITRRSKGYLRHATPTGDVQYGFPSPSSTRRSKPFNASIALSSHYESFHLRYYLGSIAGGNQPTLIPWISAISQRQSYSSSYPAIPAPISISCHSAPIFRGDVVVKLSLAHDDLST